MEKGLLPITNPTRVLDHLFTLSKISDLLILATAKPSTLLPCAIYSKSLPTLIFLPTSYISFQAVDVDLTLTRNGVLTVLP